jgi:hypothetical protein
MGEYPMKKIKKIIILLVIFLEGLILQGLLLQGATINVTTFEDNVAGSLREAITTANSNGEDDIINLTIGTYLLTGNAGDDANLSGDLDIDTEHSITIIGYNAAATFIDGNKIDRVFHIHNGTVIISKVTIREGQTPDGTQSAPHAPDGGGIYNKGNLTVNDCTIADNFTGRGYNSCVDHTVTGNCGNGGYGGGIYNNPSGVLTVNDTTIISNFTGKSGGGYTGFRIGNGGHGGGICNGGHMTLNNCTVTGNRTGQGEHYYCGGAAQELNNGGSGGGIYNFGIQCLNGCTISSNVTGFGIWSGSSEDGGGICNTDGGESTLTECIIHSNTGISGALFNNSTASLTDTYIYSNTSKRGGGIFNISSDVNTGIIYLSGCTISQNQTESGGYNEQGGNGGGIYNASALNAVNCTVSSNTTGSGGVHAAGGNGGGIYNRNSTETGYITMIHCTIANNTTGEGYSYDNVADGSGGGIYVKTGTILMSNSILADNFVPSNGSGNDGFGVFTSQGYNLIEDTDQITVTGIITGNITGKDPKLNSLAHNGGPTKTHGLFPDSPAIDAGSAFGVNTDQRGGQRPVDVPGIKNIADGSDIGAYEAVESFTISGRITLNATGMRNVTLTFSYGAGTAVTDSSGNYSHPVPYGYSGTVTPTSPGYTFSPAFRRYDTVISNQATQDFAALPTAAPQLYLDRTQLNFGAEAGSGQASTESFIIANSGGGILNWTISITPGAGWLTCTPDSGTNSATITATADPSSLSPGSYPAQIIVESPEAANSPLTVDVTLTVYAAGTGQAPFGSFDTPLDSAVVTGSIPVTGWALDDIGVEKVDIYRTPVSGEGYNIIYIGSATFVEGARPDVELQFPEYPGNNRAGWGYMMLTNFLPAGGNGIFTLYARAIDTEGHTVNLGTKTITCDNANAVNPFGAIDTPPQGGTVSGNAYINFGWALTPLPGTIPIDGSTITVWVDGIDVGHPTYNQYREDIATLFPGYNNSNGAVGYFYLDTTPYDNGTHTIQWTVTDNNQNTDGIGSRFFTVNNTLRSAGGLRRLSEGQRAAPFGIPVSLRECLRQPLEMMVDASTPVLFRRGFDLDNDYEQLFAGQNGSIDIAVNPLERLEIQLWPDEDSRRNGTTRYEGYSMIANRIGPLPTGSTLDKDNGVFYWMPGPGFLGTFELIFLEKSSTDAVAIKRIIITINPTKSPKRQ